LAIHPFRIGRRSVNAGDKTPQANVSPRKNVLHRLRPERFSPAFVLAFLILFALWIVFSGRFDGFHLTMGFLSSALVAAISGDLMFTSRKPSGVFGLWLRLAGYVPWLLVQIFLANLHVMVLVFHPRMMDLINPKIIKFDSRLKSDYARTLFASSITLTPGTITVDVTVLGRFSVHCIDDLSGQSLPGRMEEKIIRIFRE
jgi:multicomponent Na+:H+ antiporter subunit E